LTQAIESSAATSSLPESIPAPPETAKEQPPEQDSVSQPSAKSSRRPPLEITKISPDTLTPAGFYEVWKKLDTFPYFFDDSVKNPFDWAALMIAPNTAAFLMGPKENPAGIFWAAQIVKGISAICSFAALSRQGWGREKEVRAIMKGVAQHFKLRYFTALTAEPNDAIRHFIRRLGGQKKGTLAEALCYHDVWTTGVINQMMVRDLEK